MPRFEFDSRKAAANLRKHRVSFDEALTVFADPLRSTLPDDEHSLDEQRFIVVGQSTRGRVLFVVTLNQTPAFASSAHASPPRPSENNMKKSPKRDPLAERPDLDFSKGVRGRYTNTLAKGTNLAIIDPALMVHFPDSESVNTALRAFLAIGKQVKSASIHASRKAPRSVAIKRNATFNSRKQTALKARTAAR